VSLFSFRDCSGWSWKRDPYPLPCIILIGFGLYYPIVIRAEERKLSEVHNTEFDRYVDSTRRFFPSYVLLEERQEYVVNPKTFRKGLFDALWFVRLVVILEIIEAFHEYEILPMLLSFLHQCGRSGLQDRFYM